MKSAIALSGFLAVVLIDAAAIFDLERNLKRAVDITSNALKDPVQLTHPDCYLAGGACSQAERETLALAEAAANTYIAINPNAEACYASGASCNVAKRHEFESIESQAAAMSSANITSDTSGSDWVDGDEHDGLQERSADPRIRYAGNKFCFQAGESCAKSKRSPDAVANPRILAANKFCFQAGEACTKKKRAIEAVAGALPKYATDRLCFQAEGTCAKAERSLKQLRDLAVSSM